MPNYLSQGSRHFNQARRIHPKDPISQLDYYLPSSGASNSSLDSSPHSLVSGASTLSRRHKGRKILVSSPEYFEDGQSPVNSSGFSEDTHAEASVRASYPRQAHQVPLGESRSYRVPRELADSSRHHHQRRYEMKNIEFTSSSGSASSASARSGGGGILRRASAVKRSAAARGGGGQQNMTRLKRRNINRINRRMLTVGEEGFGNPYALSELFSQSEIPGFREIFASDSYLRKFCWIVAFLIMTILSLNDMTTLITEYYDYPITVDVRLRDSARLPFPSVTVCNLNVVRSSSLCSSSASSKFDMTNKIPSEMRDKLCGIQVEKKNTTESDINDINNIGITTTTTTTTSTTTTTTAPTTSVPATGATTGLPSLTTTPASGATVTSGSEVKQPVVSTAGSADSSTPSATQSNASGGGGQAEHKNDKTPNPNNGDQTTTLAPSSSSSTRRPPGALDLGDFANPALLMDRSKLSRYRSGPSSRHERRYRSIKMTDFDSQQADDDRPFASSKSRIRVRQSVNHNTMPSEMPNNHHDSTLRRILNPKNQQQTASQFNKVGPNGVSANRVNNQIRGGFQVPPNSMNNNPNGNTNNNNNNNNKDPNNLNNNNNINLLNGNSMNPFAYSSPPSASVPQVNNASTFNMPIISEDFELTERQERELQENLTNWLAVMNQRDSQFTWSLGHQFDDMILRCTMKSINCTHQRSFEKHFSPTEGNCFTYRSRIKRKAGTKGGSKYEEANLAGTNHGLELVLNLEKNEYISGSSQVGALVMIHHPSDLGYAASEATFIAPEYTTYIGLKMVNITRLPAPHPEYCVDNWPSKFADKMTRNNTYSQQACLKICLQKTIQSHCQCQSAFLPIVELDFDSSSSASSSSPAGSTSDSVQGNASSSQQQQQSQQPRIIICDTRKSHTRQCVREVMFRAADRVHNCECPPKCQVIRYDKTISMARWPTNEDKVTFDRGKMDINFQNLAKVIVYFQTMTCEEVAQQAVYSPAKLFSALGGIMGMYVGFSFLSVFEIFEVMSRKLWHYLTLKIYNTTSRLRG